MRMMQVQIKKVASMSTDELMTEAKNIADSYDLLLQIIETGKLPVVKFAVGRGFPVDCIIPLTT